MARKLTCQVCGHFPVAASAESCPKCGADKEDIFPMAHRYDEYYGNGIFKCGINGCSNGRMLATGRISGPMMDCPNCHGTGKVTFHFKGKIED